MATGLDTQALGEALVEDLEMVVGEEVNNMNPLQDVMEFDSSSFKGRHKKGLAQVGRNPSPMGTRERGASASAGHQQKVPWQVDMRKMTARYELTWEAMHDADGGEGSFIDGQEDEANRLIQDMAKRQEFWLATDGRGVLARVDEADPDGDNTLELDAPGGVTGDDFGNRFIGVGDIIACVNPATGALRATGAGKEVTAKNTDGTDVTCATSGATDWANSDYVVKAASTTVATIVDTEYEAAWWGLEALIDDGTNRDNYYGISRTTYDNFSSYVLASTGALSLDLLQRVADVVNQGLGGKISLMLAHHSVRRLYIQLLEADRRYSGSDLKKPDGGTAAFKQGDLTMGEVPIRAITDLALGKMYLLDVEGLDLKQYVRTNGEWVKDDGSVLRSTGVGSSFADTWEAIYRISKNNFAKHPKNAARLDDITGQTLVIVPRL